MRSGMGDTIFTPLYEILTAQRGVRVEFFRRVKNLGLSADGSSVASIELSRQVDLAPGVTRYDPLVPIPVEGGTRVLPCWPSEPQWSQVADGAAIAARLAEKHLTLESAWCQQETGRETLRAGEHFDLVVLGISVAELRNLCGELSSASPAWQAMLDGIATVQTHAFQLWLTPTLEGLGWKQGTTIMTGYAEPFDTWGDMSHLVPMEVWPAADAPKTIAYFCAAKREPERTPPFTDSSFPWAQYELTRRAAADFCAWRLGLVWPDGVVPSGKRPLNANLLVAPDGGSAEERFAQQYFRANIDPTERYVLSVPGTTKLRLAAGASGFANLYLAGDWIRTSMMAGCAEAGIESGMRASQAICGVPTDISGDWT
jgi:uncharacterized protein with NAD-binding domain and iron-sulfur cluster